MATLAWPCLMPATCSRKREYGARTVAARLVHCAAIALLVLSAARAAADGLRLRIAWGGGAECTWQGTISVSDGSISEPQPLGAEADEPGSMWLDGNPHGDQAALVVQQRSSRRYDGVDVLASAAPSAKLIVHLSAADQRDRPATVEIPLADLTGEFIKKDLDNQGNRVLVMRAPGDSLRVRFTRENLVFAPGEKFQFTLEPHALPLPNGGSARIRIQLLGGGKELWSQEPDVRGERAETISVEVPLPNVEGVYEIVITAVNSPRWSQAVRQPFSWKRTIAQRRVQLLVLDPQRPAVESEAELTQVVEIDPANPRWYDKFNRLPQIQLSRPRLRMSRGPLGDDCFQTQRHPLGDLAQLKPNADSPDVSWEAYWLPLNQPGRPHAVEIEYPSDVPQTLGVSILEPTAAGGLAPLVVNSSLANAAPAVGLAEKPRWQRHRVIFWPHTTSPLLVISNGREHSPAVYGKIRVWTAGQRLPRAKGDRAGANRRLLAAYLEHPLIPENFAADECPDSWSGENLDDWTTFYQGGTRLVEYLNHAGYNGLMLGVLADGSTIYPSALVQPTPRYDTGVLFATAQDPIRKDVLEMLLRLFDREDLQLIPMVEFTAPLPELEALRRGGNDSADGIEWIGAEGTALCNSSPPQRGLGPYYNVLDPRVQRAMLGVLHEVISRYARHPSLTGVAVRLSADGYAQLPGPQWGLDDATIARFERDAKLQVPGYGPQRFAQRAAFLGQEPQRHAWLEWRAEQLAKFYRRVHDELAAIRPGSRLYLAGAGMVGGPDLDRDLRPTLPHSTTIASALLRVGIDARHYHDQQRHIVLLRPERIAPDEELGSRAGDLEISQMADIDRYFQTSATPGSLFFHPAREYHVESFDRKSPFKPAYTLMVSEPSLPEQQNRRRFAHSLATLDSQVMLDGGSLLPLGQEASIRELVAAYRALPAIRFQPVGGETDDAAQPVVFRYGTYGGRTYLYAVNDAPFAVTARLHIEAAAGCRIDDLSAMREIEPLKPDGTSGFNWEIALGPYDLAAVQLSEPNVQCSAPRVAWPDAVESALGLQIRRLGARAAVLRNPPALGGLANPGFECPATANNPIPNWSAIGQGKVNVRLDKTEKHTGKQSVKMSSDGPVTCLVSQPLTAPATGRFALSVWLRIADAARQPPLRLAIDGKLHGRDFYKFGPVGLPPNAGQPAAAIGKQWGLYIFQVDDLPLEGLTSVHARFDLMGAGEVWIDDVQVSTLMFSGPEMFELSKLITLADVKLQRGQIGDCVHLLEGYWPRFLEENVALPAGALSAETVETKPRADEEKPPERSGWLNRMKDLVPDSLRF